MLRIDNSLLQEVGLGNLPDSEKNSLLKHIYETLEMRVGVRLADQMTNEQLDEFERYFEAKDDEGAFKWLESNFPNYKDIVQQEFDKLKAEISQSAPQILSASQAQASTVPQQQVNNDQQQPQQNQQLPPQPAPTTPLDNTVSPSSVPQSNYNDQAYATPTPIQQQSEEAAFPPQPTPNPAAPVNEGQTMTPPSYTPPVTPAPASYDVPQQPTQQYQSDQITIPSQQDASSTPPIPPQPPFPSEQPPAGPPSQN